MIPKAAIKFSCQKKQVVQRPQMPRSKDIADIADALVTLLEIEIERANKPRANKPRADKLREKISKLQEADNGRDIHAASAAGGKDNS